MKKILLFITLAMLTGCVNKANNTIDKSAENAKYRKMAVDILTGSKEYQPSKIVYIKDENINIYSLMFEGLSPKYRQKPYIEVKAFFNPYLLKNGWTMGCAKSAKVPGKFVVILFQDKEFKVLLNLTESDNIVQKCIMHGV